MSLVDRVARRWAMSQAKEASFLGVKLRKGSVLYHGTPNGNAFDHPTGPSWFTPGRDTAGFYTPDSWDRKVRPWVEKQPRILKYRVSREVTLPWIGEPFKATKGSVLAHFAVKAQLGDEDLLEEAIDLHGVSSAASWEEPNLDDKWDAEWWADQRPGLLEVFSELGRRFKGVVAFMDFLGKATSFQGWIQRYDGGGMEIALFSPRSVLSLSARQKVVKKAPPRRVRVEEMRKEVARKREVQRALQESARKEEAAKRTKDLKYQVLGYMLGWPDTEWDDPEVRKAIKEWQKWLTPGDFDWRSRDKSWEEIGIRVATKDDYEKEDEEVRRLQRPVPKKKPPRQDLRREKVQDDDEDTRTQGADEDRDLSMNYKRIASIDNVMIRYLFARDVEAEASRKNKAKKLAPGKFDNDTSSGKWRAKNQDGVQKYFEDKDEAEAFAEAASDPEADEGSADKPDEDKPDEGQSDEDKSDEKPERKPEPKPKPKPKTKRQQQQEQRQKGLDDMRAQMKGLFGGFETPEEKKLKEEKAALEKATEADKVTKEKLESKLKPIKDLHAKIKKLQLGINGYDDNEWNDGNRSRGYGGGDDLTDIFESADYQEEVEAPDATTKNAELQKLLEEKAALIEQMKTAIKGASKEQAELKEVDDRMQVAKDRGYEVDEKLRDLGGGGGYGYGQDEDDSEGFTLKQDEKAAARARKSFESMSEDEQIAAAASYREAMQTLTKDWAGEGLTDAHVDMAVKAMKDSFAGVSNASPEERGKMMAEFAFARRFVLDPAVVTGEPLSDQDESRDQLEARASAAMKVYDRLTPSLRSEAAEMVSKQLAHADPKSPEHDQLMAVAQGLYTAAMMNLDEDGRPEAVDIKGPNGERLFPAPTERGSALARQLKENGDVGLMFAPPGKFFEPEGREAVGRAMDSLNDKQLKDVVAEEWKDILDLLNEVDDYGLPVVGSGVKNFIRGFMKAQAINDMTIVQGFMEATCKANGIDDVKTIMEEGRKMRSVLKDDDELKAAREAMLKCMSDAGSDADKAAACREQGKAHPIKQLETLNDHVEENYDTAPDATDPSVARASAARKNKDTEALDLKLVDDEKEAA